MEERVPPEESCCICCGQAGSDALWCAECTRSGKADTQASALAHALFDPETMQREIKRLLSVIAEKDREKAREKDLEISKWLGVLLMMERVVAAHPCTAERCSCREIREKIKVELGDLRETV